MNYFYELLESYSRLKKRSLRLLEEDDRDRSGGQRRKSQPPSQEALAQANKYFNSGKSSNGQQIPVTELPPAYVTVNGTGKVVFTGYPGARYGKEYPLQSKQDIDELARLLDKAKGGASADQGTMEAEQGAKVGVGMGGAAMVAQPPKATYDFAPREFVSQQDYEKIVDHICEKINDEAACNKLRSEYFRLVNTGDSGTIARAIDQYRYIAAQCISDPSYCRAVKATNQDQKLKNRTSAYVKYALSLIKKGGKLNKHEADWLKTHVIISSKSGQIIIMNPSNGQGMLFQDTSDHMRMLLAEGAKTLMDENGDQIDLTVSTDDFIKISQPSQASVLRGQFLEDLHVASFMVRQCTALPEGPQKNACNKNARNYLLKWKDKIGNLKEAFKEYLSDRKQQEAEGGVLASDLDSDDALFSQLSEMFGSDASDPTFPVNELIRRLQHMTARGIMTRNPDFIVPMGKVTGYGRRADAMEIFNTREGAIAALIREGYSKQMAEKLVSNEPVTKEKICSDKKLSDWCRDQMSNFNSGFAINISLKNYYDLQAEKLKLGQQSMRDMNAMIDGTHCKPGDSECEALVENNLKYVAKSLGIQSTNINTIRRELKEINNLNKELEKNFDFMKKSAVSKKYVDKNGKLKQRASLENLIDTTLKSVLKNTDQKDPVFKELKSTLHSSIERLRNREEGVDEDEILSEISLAVEQQKINDMLNSKDPDQKKLAERWVASRALFTGGSSDNCAIQVNELKSGESYLIDQNAIMDEFGKIARGEKSDLKIQRSGSKGFELVDSKGNLVAAMEHSMTTDKDGKPNVTIRVKISSDTIKNRGSQNVIPTKKPTELNNSTILKYIKNQQIILEEMFKLITKGV